MSIEFFFAAPNHENTQPVHLEKDSFNYSDTPTSGVCVKVVVKSRYHDFPPPCTGPVIGS